MKRFSLPPSGRPAREGLPLAMRPAPRSARLLLGTVASLLQIGASASLADSTAAATSYFPKEEVAAAFAKGAVLYANPRDSYMVHASRREAPGQAEVHLRDADIIYVLDGTATFVTGGAIVDGKVTAPDEIRGKEIAGGESRTLAKGDVIIVPQGTPHWFKEVGAPFLYYVVKVR